MLPPGHLAGGYLAAYGLLKLSHAAFDASQIQTLLLIGALAGFSPDLDHFITFARAGSLRMPVDENNHRNLFTHTPAFWLMICAALYLVLPHTEFNTYLVLTILVGSWSHFFLDLFIHGIRLLWPFTNTKFAFFNKDIRPTNLGNTFWRYWWSFVKWYTHYIAFYLEIIIILFTVFLILHSSFLIPDSNIWPNNK